MVPKDADICFVASQNKGNTATLGLLSVLTWRVKQPCYKLSATFVYKLATGRSHATGKRSTFGEGQ